MVGGERFGPRISYSSRYPGSRNRQVSLMLKCSCDWLLSRHNLAPLSCCEHTSCHPDRLRWYLPSRSRNGFNSCSSHVPGSQFRVPGWPTFGSGKYALLRGVSYPGPFKRSRSAWSP
jgi:hypothetical protein